MGGVLKQGMCIVNNIGTVCLAEKYTYSFLAKEGSFETETVATELKIAKNNTTNSLLGHVYIGRINS